MYSDWIYSLEIILYTVPSEVKGDQLDRIGICLFSYLVETTV